MLSLRRILRGPEQSVRSLAVQAEEPTAVPQSTVFEVLTRHLLHRLVHNEALGEEIPTRITQLAYMFALPGVLMALYLSAPYHQPQVIGPRPFWLQISDHYVYTVYSLVVMGAVTVFEWDLLFPDLLDVYVLTSLPIPQRRLLLARLLALAILLTLVLLGTNLLGTLFFPAVADLHGMWWRHVSAHFATVAMAGAFSAGFFVALQGGLLCLFGRRIFAWIAPLVQALSIAVLLTILFLTPLLCAHLQELFESGAGAVWLFPPFWFLGLYERLLWGSRALPIFLPLANSAVFATVGALALALATYPVAYARRTRQLIEGGESSHRRSSGFSLLRSVLYATLLRSSQQRAIYHFIGQTVFRTPRLRLYLSIYAGVGVALAISGLLLLQVYSGKIHLAISTWGLRAVVPILVFLAPVGLRTAFRAPVGMKGSWIFHVIHGGPTSEHLSGTRRWVVLHISLVATASLGVLCLIVPALWKEGSVLLSWTLVAAGMSLLLSELFFLRVHQIPFTTTQTPSTTDLPVSFVRYVVILPAFVLKGTDLIQWVELSRLHLAICMLLFAMVYLGLRSLRQIYAGRHKEDSIFTDEFIGQRLGLQDY